MKLWLFQIFYSLFPSSSLQYVYLFIYLLSISLFYSLNLRFPRCCSYLSYQIFPLSFDAVILRYLFLLSFVFNIRALYLISSLTTLASKTTQVVNYLVPFSRHCLPPILSFILCLDPVPTTLALPIYILISAVISGCKSNMQVP